MAKMKYRTRNTTKIADLLQELRLSEGELRAIMREVNVRVEEGQNNLDQNEVGRIRRYLNEQRRRAELRGQTIALPPVMSVRDLAERLELPVGNILGALLSSGVVASLNDDIDYETAAIIAEDLGYKTEERADELEKDVLTPEKLEEILKKEPAEQQAPRPPVVAIMGHVDHGKTTLLDAIRKTNVAKSEAGGITQAISSYQTEYKGRVITFIDTPGHETFEFMRKRGASLADIAVLVVAADDGVKPQTKEAVSHARAAGVPIIVAINKMDKPAANLDRVKGELAEMELTPEDWGGKTVTVPVSALKVSGIDDLLEMILLTADVDQPKANPKRMALASVVESRLDKHLGPLATVLVHTGTLRPGDDVVIGTATGRVRRIVDWRGKTVQMAEPSAPVTIVGLNIAPAAGEILQAVEAGEEAREKAGRHRAPTKTLSKTDEDDERAVLALVLKADSKGSIEALGQTITAMVPEEVRLSIIRAEVGAVSDSDVLTAQAAKALIYAFNVGVGGMAKRLADKEAVPLKMYKVIYELTDDIRQQIEERLPVDVVHTDLGVLKVLKIFFAAPKRKIVGGEVTEGAVEAPARAIVWRKVNKIKSEIGRGAITNMQRERHEIARAAVGDQVGLTYEGKGKIKEGDTLEIYKEEKVRRIVGTSNS